MFGLGGRFEGVEKKGKRVNSEIVCVCFSWFTVVEDGRASVANVFFKWFEPKWKCGFEGM